MSSDSRTSGSYNPQDVPPKNVSAIPLSDPATLRNGDPSIGSLVKDATTHLSSLVRGEVELAKAELTSEVKKAVIGSAAFIIAAVVLLYSSFFFFFFLGEVLAIWLPRWAAYGIVFLIMVVLAAIVGFVGFLFVKKIQGPKKTIASVKEVPGVLPTGKDSADAPRDPHIDRMTKATQERVDKALKA